MSCFLWDAVTLTNVLSPKGRIDADVVRLWESRCSPPAAGGWRRKILLILRLQLCCVFFMLLCHFRLILPRVLVPAAVPSCCFS